MSCPCVATVVEAPTTLVRGDTARWVICFSDADGVALNVAGWEIWLTLRDELDTPLDRVFLVRSVLPNDADALIGRAIITAHSVDTASLLAGKYFYEFKRVLQTVPPDVWTFDFSTQPTFKVYNGVVLYSTDDSGAAEASPHTYVVPTNAGVGPRGPIGASAYDVWISQGNTGTEQDFLNSLVGGESNPSITLDVTGNTYWYVRYSDRIARIDHSVAPPLVLNYVATITDVMWNNRQALTYV